MSTSRTPEPSPAGLGEPGASTRKGATGGGAQRDDSPDGAQVSSAASEGNEWEVNQDDTSAALKEALRQRRELESDWQRLLAAYRALESRHEEIHADLLLMKAERNGHERTCSEATDRAGRLERQVSELQERLREVEQERDSGRDSEGSDKTPSDASFQGLLAEHRKLCGMHEAALLELDRLSQRLERAEHVMQPEQVQLARELDEARSQLERIYASRSWALTRPLREVRRIGGWLLPAQLRALMRRRRQLRLPPPSVGFVGLGQEPVEALDRVRHAALADFLNAEFGAVDARATVERIERYALQVEAGNNRGAVKDGCDEEQALAWARELAGMVASSALDANQPEVSIIIPVHNQARFTLACLESIIQHRTRFRFEIIVGDDASNDATAAALSVRIPGVRHVRHELNLGFVRNCNAAAALARGRYLVFLNNDTLVLPNWLDELVGALERDETIGLSGSKLVFPDGRLQECGAIVWNDGSAWNLGRFDDPRKPEYCYLRDTDYVSGASLALRTELWRELDGFDELFAPAYAEDADLAFRVRGRGLRTVVQPLSQIIHFEGVTSGTDVSQGAKAHQVENLRKLAERWRAEIAGHRPNAERPDLEKERGIRRRVLFIDSVTPTPNEDAGSLVAWEVMAAFRKVGYKVTFVPEDNFAHVGADTADLQRLGVETIYHPSYSFMADFLAARHDPFDVIFLHRYKVAETHLRALRRRYPRAKVLFLNADMHFLREMREAELLGDRAALSAARRTRDRELEVVRSVDCTLVHSEAELAMLKEECPGLEIELFPLIQGPVARTAPLRGREGVCFVGGYRHPPNEDGIVWFVEKAWPRVLERMPEARLYIAGSNATERVVALGARPNVEFVGFVKDIGGFLDRRRISVAPLRYGAGAKGKVALSLAHGLPTVCTPIAAEGMQLTDGVNVHVGETADALADHIATLLADDREWERMSEAGVAYAHEVTAPCHAHRRVRTILKRWGIG